MARGITSALAAFAALLISPTAWAQGTASGPPVDAAIAVYVEQIPTAGGTVAAGRAKGKKATLAPKLRTKLTERAGADALALEAVATSPALGAPPERVTSRPRTAQTPPATGPRTAQTPPLSPAPPPTAATASRRDALLLAVMLLAITAGGIVVRVRRPAEPQRPPRMRPLADPPSRF